MGKGGYDLEEIRRRADIVEIISPHVALRRSGGKRLTGLCPFHQERSPSFSVDPEKGVWHCFGCKAGGDIFDFVEQIEKVTFAEAAELLGRRYGVAPRSSDGGVRQRQKERLLALHEQAADFFQRSLKSAAGKSARAYLEKRGLSAGAAAEFGIGYALPTWESLVPALGQQGFSLQEMAQAGLAVTREGRHYDRFRDRIIFPIWDSSGRVIAFGGRAMQDDQPPKYLNSPETPLFSKGRVLYAFDRARKAMDEAGRAIVVEGYLDAIACHEAGFRETVATLGTALTPDHVDLLRRRVSQVVLCFDADSAGMSAALRSRDLFQQAELTVRVITLPDRVDPDQLVREQGREAFAALVEAAVPMVEWELRRILARPGGPRESDRVGVFQEAVVALTRVPPGVEREYYIRWLAQQWAPGDVGQAATMEEGIRAELARSSTRKPAGVQRREIAAPDNPRPERSPAKPAAGHRVEADLLAAFLQHGRHAPAHLRALEAEDFPEEAHRQVFVALRELVEAGQAVTPEAVMDRLEGPARGELAQLALREVPSERVQELMERDVNRLLERRLAQQYRGLLQRLTEIGPGSEQEALRAELNDCASRLNELKARRSVGS